MSQSDKPNSAVPASPAAEDAAYLEQERRRRDAEADLEVHIVEAARGSGPVQPVRLTTKDSFCFSCHKGVSCWNECCHDPDITLTPADILRLAKHFETRPSKFNAIFAAAAVHDQSGMPVMKLKVVDNGQPKKPCVFLDETEGCTVYKDRPAACRYYPLGLASVKMKGHEEPEEFYFLVKEGHCKGHDEQHVQTVGDFRKEQGVEDYDEINRGWVHLLMKLASWKTLGGPWGQEPDERTRKMFFMATTDIDAFRMFVFNSTFLDKYEISAEQREELAMNDEALLKLAFDWLRNLMFNEPTIALREHVLHDAIAKARGGLGGT
jgi:Fe-S-cluster containining protein